MEQAGPRIIFMPSAIDSLTSMAQASLHSEAETLLSIKLFSHLYFSHAAADEYLEAWTNRMRELVGPDNKPSQILFWRFFDNVRDTRKQAAPCRAFDVEHEASRANPGRPFEKTLRFELPEGPLVMDGQHRLAAVLNDARRDLSRRDILRVLQTVFDRITDCEAGRTFFEVLDSSLVEEVAKLVRLKDSRRNFDLQENRAPSTREWVLGFFFRTGNPPPRSGRWRPASGRVPVNLFTAAWREDYAAVQGQEDSRSLRDAVREQRTKTRFNRGAQNHANLDGRRQSAGRRHPRPHRSLAQCA
jgi:hypothetical protein